MHGCQAGECIQQLLLTSRHAMRMALDMNLHRALDKLANGDSGERSEAEERDLGASSGSKLPN
jgi:hypothetical protein